MWGWAAKAGVKAASPAAKVAASKRKQEKVF